jgi:hypothetical protein
MGDHAEQMQGFGMIGLGGEDRAIAGFRLIQAARSMVSHGFGKDLRSKHSCVLPVSSYRPMQRIRDGNSR